MNGFCHRVTLCYAYTLFFFFLLLLLSSHSFSPSLSLNSLDLFIFPSFSMIFNYVPLFCAFVYLRSLTKHLKYDCIIIIANEFVFAQKIMAIFCSCQQFKRAFPCNLKCSCLEHYIYIVWSNANHKTVFFVCLRS